jgi:MFS family permease
VADVPAISGRRAAGLVFAVSAVGMFSAGGLFGALSHRVRLNALLSASVTVGLIAGAAQILISVTHTSMLATSWIFTFLAMSAMGMVIPAVMSIGQGTAKHAPGGAAALLGGGQCLFGAIASPLVGLLGTNTDTPMALIMVIGFGCATVALFTLARPWQGAGEHEAPTGPSAEVPAAVA